MATTPRPSANREIDYPTSDGKPMAETDVHRQDMIDLIETLQDHFADDPDVYVTGNLLLYYERGNPRRHVSPDVFVVRGVEKGLRDYYLLWEEGKSPDVVIEITSKTTRRKDQKKKLILYRDALKVPEYFQFDPTEDYLKPPMQGHRLVEGQYVSIEPIEGRLPSALLGLHLERDGLELRLYDPSTGHRLLKPRERMIEAEAAAEAARREAEAEAAEQLAEERAQLVEAENERLRREMDALLRKLSGGA
ncbi:MAG TPA: Uma2 family endonuclease [Isosphaeraceae bacterium]|nr:Uma2 family endonuclease [Isosphaeraceae bacterium]